MTWETAAISYLLLPMIFIGSFLLGVYQGRAAESRDNRRRQARLANYRNGQLND